MERHKRSIFARDCGDTASNGTLLPEQQLTSSRPNVTFGQYEKTVNWYANVSWNPVKDPDGVFKGYLVNLGFGSRLGILCSVLPKVRDRVIPSISFTATRSSGLIDWLLGPYLTNRGPLSQLPWASSPWLVQG